MKDVYRLIVAMRFSTVWLIQWIFPAGMQLNGILHDPSYHAILHKS